MGGRRTKAPPAGPAATSLGLPRQRPGHWARPRPRDAAPRPHHPARRPLLGATSFCRSSPPRPERAASGTCPGRGEAGGPTLGLGLNYAARGPRTTMGPGARQRPGRLSPRRPRPPLLSPPPEKPGGAGHPNNSARKSLCGHRCLRFFVNSPRSAGSPQGAP